MVGMNHSLFNSHPMKKLGLFPPWATTNKAAINTCVKDIFGEPCAVNVLCEISLCEKIVL